MSGDIFGGLRSGIKFPEVVMNNGPLPGTGASSFVFFPCVAVI